MPSPRLRLVTRVPAADRGTTLLDYLASRFRYLPREAWEAKIAAGDVRVGGALASPWLRLERGMELSYESDHREPPVDTEIAVLLETPDVLAVAKPAGLPMHADGVFIRNTLVHVLRERRGAELQPAHRLDRETSGVVVLGRHKAAAQALQMQFQRSEVTKTYLAIVRGRIAQDALTIDCALAPAAQGVTLRRVPATAGTPGAQTALTEVRVLRRGARSTLVEATPRTGRTHQIRAHLASVGHGIVGDVLYGRDDEQYLAWVHHVKAGGDAAWPSGRDAPRQMLHAARIAMRAPDGAPLDVAAPLPPDMLAQLDADPTA